MIREMLQRCTCTQDTHPPLEIHTHTKHIYKELHVQNIFSREPKHNGEGLTHSVLQMFLKQDSSMANQKVVTPHLSTREATRSSLFKSTGWQVWDLALLGFKPCRREGEGQQGYVCTGLQSPSGRLAMRRNKAATRQCRALGRVSYRFL